MQVRLLLIAFLFVVQGVYGQLPWRDSLITKRRFIAGGVPVIFYTPETRFGFGASAFGLFNMKGDSVNAPRSTASLGFAYTQNKQILSYFPYNLFIRNRAWQVYGEFSYNRYLYDFYGTGNSLPRDYVERYGVEFPRIRLTVLKKLNRWLYAGPRFVYDWFTLYDLQEGGLLDTRSVYGSEGGRVAGPAAVVMVDRRDFMFYPTKGMWGEFVVFYNSRETGSSFNYTRIAVDVSKYFGYGRHVLALNFYTIYSDSPLPFFQMGQLGGMKKMRGFYEGRYRDNNALALQAEYRFKLTWWLGTAMFGSMGQVAKTHDAFNNRYWQHTYGAGLRICPDRVQRLNLRIDFAVGHGKVLPYFTIGEAF